MKSLPLSMPLVALVLVSLAACKKKSAEPGSSAAGDVAQQVAPEAEPNRIVVTQRTQVVAESDPKSKHLAMVQPGETMEFLGDSVESGKNEQMYKVKLSDGTEGWARNYGLIMGKAGAIVREASLYERPTTLSPSRQKLSMGRLVGVLDTMDEFVKVSANKWQTGWVERNAISREGADVLAAALAGAAMGKKTGKEALEAGLAAITDRSSALAVAMQARLDSLAGGQAPAADTAAAVATDTAAGTSR